MRNPLQDKNLRFVFMGIAPEDYKTFPGYSEVQEQLSAHPFGTLEFHGLALHEDWFVFPLVSSLSFRAFAHCADAFEHCADEEKPIKAYALVTKALWQKARANKQMRKAKALLDAVLSDYERYNEAKAYQITLRQLSLLADQKDYRRIENGYAEAACLVRILTKE